MRYQDAGRRLFEACIGIAWLAAGSTNARADPEVQALAVATGVVVAAAIAAPAQAEPDRLAFEAGRLDAIKNVQPATALGIEVHLGASRWWKLEPFLGAGFTSRHSFYGYGGIRLPTYWGERVAITPSFAIGGYGRGEGKDLGNPAAVGRFGLDVEYRFDNDLRVGLAYHHISNGKLLGQATNPGTEIVGLTLSMPLR